MPSNQGTSPSGTPAQPQSHNKKEFNADKRPKAFHYNRVDEIPRLPGPLTESQFYAQWADQTRLNGFPLIEEQDFIVGHCLDDGNCYWSVIAILIYGSDQYWPWVKAQHYLWVSQVSENESHPRYALYRRLLESILHAKNLRRQNASPPIPLLPPTAFNAMGIPNGWTSTDMTPITADLYGINLVIFLMDKSNVNKPDKFNPVLVKGHPNAPSRFMRFMNNNHFEPMRPDVSRPSEFRYPLINSETTKNFPNANKSNKPKQPHQHSWRTGGQPHSRGGIDEELFPKPVLPLPSESDLAFVIGQQAIEKAFTREPGWLPPINAAQVELAKRDVTRIVEGARAVYHSWTEPFLLLECARRQIAPAVDNPARSVLIESLLTHDREVATRLVTKAHGSHPPPPAAPSTPQGPKTQPSPQTKENQPPTQPSGGQPTPQTGGVRSPPMTSGTQPSSQPPGPKGPVVPPTPQSMPGARGPGPHSQAPGSSPATGSSPTPGPPIGPGAGPSTTGGVSTASPQPKKNTYGSLRKGDLIAEVRKRGLVVKSADTVATLRRTLEEDDARKESEGKQKEDEIKKSKSDDKEGGSKNISGGKESKDPGPKDEKPESEGNGKGKKRSASTGGDGDGNAEQVAQQEPKQTKKQ